MSAFLARIRGLRQQAADSNSDNTNEQSTQSNVDVNNSFARDNINVNNENRPPARDRENTNVNNKSRPLKVSLDNADSEKVDEDVGDMPKVAAASFVPPKADLNQIKLHINRGIRFENLDKIEIKISGNDHPEPIITFADADFHTQILQNINDCNFTRFTPIQKAAIPIINNGLDMIGCAQTGSGKSAAFLLPILSKLLKDFAPVHIGDKCVAKPQALILVPTRELAVQIYDHATLFSQNTGLHCAAIYGGLAVFKSRCAMTKEGRCDILIACVGRLHDFLSKNFISLSNLKYLVLDEADKMLSSTDFSNQIEEIRETLKDMNQSVQTLLFSATFPKALQDIALRLLKNNYCFINVGKIGAANTDVVQEFIRCEKDEKEEKLMNLIADNKDKKLVVFVERKSTVDYLAITMALKAGQDNKVITLHGDRTQEQRYFAVNDFKSMEGFGVLCSTSVAARGLDLPYVDIVINYDLPSDIDTYVHRIGRTGRCGLAGQSISFFDPDADKDMASRLVRVLSNAQQPVPDWLASFAEVNHVEDDKPNHHGLKNKGQKEGIYQITFDETNN